MRRLAQSISFAAVMFSAAVLAEAREPEECQLAWGQAVRSYLTQNRDKLPADRDVAFAPACELESKGKKDDARVEAVMIGARELARLDPRGCVRFMESYVGSSKPKDVCDAANGGDDAVLRRLISESMPARKSK